MTLAQWLWLVPLLITLFCIFWVRKHQPEDVDDTSGFLKLIIAIVVSICAWGVWALLV